MEPARPGEDRGDRVGRGRLTLLMQAVVARHRAVRRLGLDGLAVRRHQHRGHEAERAEALGHGIRLHVAVVVLAGPEEAAGPFERGRHHVVDQAVLVGDVLLVEAVLELGLEDLLEQVLEAPVVDFQDGVLGREVDRPAQVQAVVEAGAREAADRVVQVVHAHGHAGAGEVEDLVGGGRATRSRLEGHGQLARAGDEKIGGPVLIAEGVTADHDGLGPAGHQARHVLHHDRLAEHGAAQDVADRAVGRAPHLLEAEFLDPRLVRGDGRALDADAVRLDGVGGVDGDAVVARVAALDREVEVNEVDVEIGLDQLVLDHRPDDPGHLVAVELDDRIRDLDLGHGGLQRGLRRRAPAGARREHSRLSLRRKTRGGDATRPLNINDLWY